MTSPACLPCQDAISAALSESGHKPSPLLPHLNALAIPLLRALIGTEVRSAAPVKRHKRTTSSSAGGSGDAGMIIVAATAGGAKWSPPEVPAAPMQEEDVDLLSELAAGGDGGLFMDRIIGPVFNMLAHEVRMGLMAWAKCEGDGAGV